MCKAYHFFINYWNNFFTIFPSFNLPPLLDIFFTFDINVMYVLYVFECYLHI